MDVPLPETVRPDAADELRRRTADIIGWVLDERLRTPRSDALLHGLAWRLLDAGLPVDRATLHIRELHPQFRGRTLFWYPQCREVEEVVRAHGIEHEKAYTASPLAAMDAENSSIRRCLEAGCPRDFPILEELAAEGYTDYCMLRVPASLDRDLGLSFATKRPGGFSDDELAATERLLPAFGTAVEVCEMRRTARLLLSTYLGHTAGERVLNGTIRRGDGEVIHAVLWLSDLHGFTELAETASLGETIGTLNAFFDCMAEPLQARGGEILKFIGDGMLAIFPCEPGADETCRAADNALETAEEALARLDALNADRPGAGQPALEAGIALHIGEVKYGNIGASDRLDFTVIGHAVNLVTRLQDLATGRDRRIVVSEKLAGYSARSFQDLGAHAFKGIATPQRALALVDGGA